MESEELVKIIGAVCGGVVIVIGACFAGARASLCKSIKCESCCCNIAVERSIQV